MKPWEPHRTSDRSEHQPALFDELVSPGTTAQGMLPLREAPTIAVERQASEAGRLYCAAPEPGWPTACRAGWCRDVAAVWEL